MAYIATGDFVIGKDFVCKQGTSGYVCTEKNASGFKSKVKSLQTQLNRVASVTKYPGAKLAVDGIVGTKTQAAVGVMYARISKKIPAPYSLYQIVVFPTPESVSTFADDLATYFKNAADDLGTWGISSSTVKAITDAEEAAGKKPPAKKEVVGDQLVISTADGGFLGMDMNTAIMVGGIGLYLLWEKKTKRGRKYARRRR